MRIPNLAVMSVALVTFAVPTAQSAPMKGSGGWGQGGHYGRMFDPKTVESVRGEGIRFNGNPVIIASEVHKGSDTLKLRDGNGIPVWSGWRRSG